MRLSCAGGCRVVELAGNGGADGAITGEIGALADPAAAELKKRQMLFLSLAAGQAASLGGSSS